MKKGEQAGYLDQVQLNYLSRPSIDQQLQRRNSNMISQLLKSRRIMKQFQAKKCYKTELIYDCKLNIAKLHRAPRIIIYNEFVAIKSNKLTLKTIH